VCEGKSFFKKIYFTDVDEDDLETGLSPRNPFYLLFNKNINYTSEEHILVSGNMDKEDAGGLNSGSKVYEETISVNDGEYADTKKTNISVIEINNPPRLTNIGSITLYTQGDNSSLQYQAEVSDVEYDSYSWGDLFYNISFGGDEKLFNISETGYMEFNATEDKIGVYNVSVCVNDTGLNESVISENIGFCNQDGGTQRDCDSFGLTITDENRVPTITSWYPSNLSLSIPGTSQLYFNISKYDPDGTIPDAYWYVDGVLKEIDEGSLNDEFRYSFGCGVSGEHQVSVVITDGLANDSLSWDIDVQKVECSPPSGGGGGGGGGGTSCEPQWACGNWDTCQNIEGSLEEGILSQENYREIKIICEEKNLNLENCGFQTRECEDINNCSTEFDKPEEIQQCFFVPEPSCFDGIKNCHDGDCEVLVDCGGPCEPCPSCSDGIQNQGEEGVDCGGPCPKACEIEIPESEFPWLVSLLWLLLLLILIFITYEILRKIRQKSRLKQQENF
jgi:hypothetical protein